MPYNIIRSDITAIKADAIVNTASYYPHVGSGVDISIYEAAGYDEIFQQRLEIGIIPVGSARYTTAGKLDAKYIIHASGPSWWKGTYEGTIDLLRKTYISSMSLASELGCSSIAFPLMGTGNKGIPYEIAIKTAVATISEYLLDSEMDVTLVVYEKTPEELSKKLLSDVSEYVNKYYQSALTESEASVIPVLPSLDMLLSNPDAAIAEFRKTIAAESFHDMLFRVIREKNYKNSEVYKRANIGKAYFAKINKYDSYIPSRDVVISLAFALRLSYDESVLFMNNAGYSLKPGDLRDIILRSYLESGKWDLDEINSTLFNLNLGMLYKY